MAIVGHLITGLLCLLLSTHCCVSRDMTFTTSDTAIEQQQDLSQYGKMIQNFLQNLRYEQLSRNKIEYFLHNSNISLPMTIMSQDNLKSVLKKFLPGTRISATVSPNYRSGNTKLTIQNLLGQNGITLLQALLGNSTTQSVSNLLGARGNILKSNLFGKNGGLLKALFAGNAISSTFLENVFRNPGNLSLNDLVKSNDSGSQDLIGNIPKLLQSVLGNNSESMDAIQNLIGKLLDTDNDVGASAIEIAANLSQQCMSHLVMLTMDTDLALRMLDATGKLPGGVLEGDTKWFGGYDECLSVKGELNGTLDGKYCLANIPIGQLFGSMLGGYPVTASLGVCVPHSCSKEETKLILDELLDLLPLGDSALATSDISCHKDTEYDNLSIAALAVCGIFACVLIVATTFDIIMRRRSKRTKGEMLKGKSYRVSESQVSTSLPNDPGILSRILLSFSVYTNGQKLLGTQQAGGALSAVNGIRFLSISWVVLGHAFSFAAESMKNIFGFYSVFLHRWTAGVIINGLMSVDSFFTLSGLLVSYLFMKEMKRERGRINWFMFYFHRFWRLTPPYMMVMFLNLSLSRYFGDGPVYPKDGFEKNFCSNTWWTNLLYVNNVVKDREMCMVWSWYLANDMQFYVVSPLMLVPLYYSKKIGSVVCFVFLLGITIATGVVSYTLNISAVTVSIDPTIAANAGDYFYLYYIRPYCRMGPYIIGILTGYTLYKTDCKYTLSKIQNLLVWSLIAVLGILVVYGVWDPVNGKAWSAEISALFNATHRTVWGMCVSWVVFACVTGNGGFVNTLLSWKAFVPLGRLSYCVYLIHPIIISHYTQSLRYTIYGNDMNFIYIFLGCMVLSFLGAFVTSLFFEAPMMALEKAVFKRGHKK